MKPAHAITLALECIDKECRRLAVDANFYDLGLATYPAAERASARRKQLREAVRVLMEERQVSF